MKSENDKFISKVYPKKYLEDLDQNNRSYHSEQQFNLNNFIKVPFILNTISPKSINSKKQFAPELVIEKNKGNYSPIHTNNKNLFKIFNLKQIIKELDKNFKLKKEIKKLRKKNDDLENINKELKEKLIESKKFIKEQTKFCDELSNCLSEASKTIMEYKEEINELKKLKENKKILCLKENVGKNKNLCVNDCLMIIKRYKEEIKEINLQKEKMEFINKKYKQDLIEMKNNIQIIQDENYRLTKKLNEINDKYNCS